MLRYLQDPLRLQLPLQQGLARQAVAHLRQPQGTHLTGRQAQQGTLKGKKQVLGGDEAESRVIQGVYR